MYESLGQTDHWLRKMDLDGHAKCGYAMPNNVKRNLFKKKQLATGGEIDYSTFIVVFAIGNDISVVIIGNWSMLIIKL